MPILTLSTTELRTGDSFDIANLVLTFSATINIVSTDPDLLDAQDTSGIAPSSDEWVAAVENLAQALSDVDIVTSVGFNIAASKTLITLDISEEINVLLLNKSVANGSKIEFISYVDSAGTKFDNTTDPGIFGLLLVPNVTVTNITHVLSDFTGATAQGYIHGNLKNAIKTEVFFTTKDSAVGKQVEFSYGLIQNTINPYVSGSTTVSEPFKMDPDFFTNRLTGTIQTFRGPVGTFASASPPVSFNTGSVEITLIAGNDYKLTHIRRIFDLGSEDVSDDATTVFLPSILEGKKSVKYVFEILVYADDITPLPDETTAKENLIPFFQDGAIGWSGQVFNSAVQPFTVNNFTWSTPRGELNPAFNSTGTSVIKNTTGPWLVTDQLVISIQNIIDDYNGAITLTANIANDKAILVADGIGVSSTNILNVTATIDGGDPTLLNISLEVLEAIYTDRYSITAEIKSAGFNTTEVLESGTAVSAADESVVDFAITPGAVLPDYNFNLHWNKTLNQAFNQVKSFTEDHYIARWRVVNTDLTNTTLSSFKIQIINKDTGTTLETLTVNDNDIPFSEQRSFKLDAVNEPEYVFITVTETGTNEWDFQYPFQVWKQWFQETNLVLRCVCSFRQVLVTGETITFRNTFDSPDFQMGDYDQTKNTALEPQALPTPLSFQYIDEATGNPLTSIKNTGITRVIATWEDNNLNDLEVVPVAPFVYTVPVINGLTGYLAVNDKKRSQPGYIEFHNVITNPTLIDDKLNPWEIISGHPSFNSKLTRIDIKTAKLEGLLNAEKLKAMFGNIDDVCVSGRLDAARIPEICFVWESAFEVLDVGGDGDFNPSISESANWILEQDTTYFPTISVPDRTITGPPFIAASELDGSIQDIKICDFDVAIVTSLNFGDKHIRNTLNLTDFVALTSIDISGNPGAFDVVFPAHSAVTTLILTNNNTSLLALDLSPMLNKGGVLRGSQSSVLATVDFGTSTELITAVDYNNCPALDNVDISGLTRVKAEIDFAFCSTLQTFTAGSSVEIIDKLQFNNCNLSAIDLSGYTMAGTQLKVNVNSNCTSFIPPATSRSWTLVQFNNLNITTVDFSSTTGLSGVVGGANNSAMTSITWPASSGLITSLNLDNTGLPALVLSTLTMSGSISAINCPSLASVTLPTSASIFTNLNFNNSVLTAFDVTPLTGANNNIAIDLGSNNINQAGLDALLVIIDAKGWTGGTLGLANQTPGMQPTGGLLNANIVSLLGKGWVVNI